MDGENAIPQALVLLHEDVRRLDHLLGGEWAGEGERRWNRCDQITGAAAFSRRMISGRSSRNMSGRNSCPPGLSRAS